MLKRALAVALCLAVLPWACAEPLEDRWESEFVHQVVDAMFAAAAGTTAAEEKAARKGLSDEEKAAREVANAEYRSKTIVWLAEVFDIEPEEAVEAEVPEDVPVDKVEWTVEDAYTAMQENRLGGEYLALIREEGGVDAQTCVDVSREICLQWLGEIDHAMLSEVNEDYFCWIYAQGTQIDYPVVHGENNEFYLTHMFNGARNSGGALFMDYRNLPDFQDPNTIIYGHHMRNDSMFGSLTDYYEDRYFDEHPFLLIVTPREIAVIEVFAGYVTDKKDPCYEIAISDEADMIDFIDTAMGKSDFDAGVEVDFTDRLVTLSTCAYAFENARYIVIGRLESAWQADETFEMAGEIQ